jgi:hypothetical protein
VQRPVFVSAWTLTVALVLNVIYKGYRQRRFYRNLVSLSNLTPEAS